MICFWLALVTTFFVIGDQGGDEALLVAARQAYQTGDFSKVVEKLEPLLKRDGSKDDGGFEARRLAAMALHRRGEDHFRNARIADAVRDFDREVELFSGSAPGHWQRGIAYYYAGEFEKGVRQFELHQKVNPQDVENAVWHFLCAARVPGGTLEKARKGLIPISRDTRVPMKQVHQLFAASSRPEDVFQAAEEGGPDAWFYADLYVGLYYEAIGRSEDSLQLIRRAAENPSGKSNYMGDVARVHVKLRTKPPKAKPAEP